MSGNKDYVEQGGFLSPGYYDKESTKFNKEQAVPLLQNKESVVTAVSSATFLHQYNSDTDEGEVTLNKDAHPNHWNMGVVIDAGAFKSINPKMSVGGIFSVTIGSGLWGGKGSQANKLEFYLMPTMKYAINKQLSLDLGIGYGAFGKRLILPKWGAVSESALPAQIATEDDVKSALNGIVNNDPKSNKTKVFTPTLLVTSASQTDNSDAPSNLEADVVKAFDTSIKAVIDTDDNVISKFIEDKDKEFYTEGLEGKTAWLGSLKANVGVTYKFNKKVSASFKYSTKMFTHLYTHGYTENAAKDGVEDALFGKDQQAMFTKMHDWEQEYTLYVSYTF